jgi:hypothetical protein
MRFTDPVPIARAVSGALMVGVILDVHRLIYTLSRHDAAAIDLPAPALHVMVRLATLVLFVTWFDRIWRNHSALSRTEPPPWWAAFVRIYRAPAVIREAWRGISAGTSADRWFSRLVVIWWVTLLTPLALVLTTFRRERSSPGELWARLLAAESLNVVAGLAATAVVLFLSTQQRQTQLAWSALSRHQSTPPPFVRTTDSAIVADRPAGDVAIPLAPGQPVAASQPRSGSPVETLIREQQKRWFPGWKWPRRR